LIGPVVIFLLSLKYGIGGHDRKNQLSLAVAMIALGLLFVTDGVLISLVLALIIDAIAISITVRKVLLDRDSESKAFWALGALASLFAILSLEEFVIAGLLYPIYALSVSAYIFLISEKDELKPKALGGKKK
jgi:membrane protease YdiL (CAAX protease family)